MKWFKHESSANRDAKLARVLMKYGLEGYGLYYFCLEMVAEGVEEHNLTFELEHDAEIIAWKTNMHHEKVEEMMAYMVKLELFENNDGTITCYKLAKRLEQSATGNAKMRKIIAEIKKNGILNSGQKVTESGQDHDPVMTGSCQSHARRDEKRLDKNNKPSMSESFDSDDDPKPVDKFTSEDFDTAKLIFKKIKNISPKSKEPNFKNWANDIRLMRERDKHTIDEIKTVFDWANNDPFWKLNILSTSKLREKFAELHAKSNKGKIQNLGTNQNYGTGVTTL